MLGVLDLITLSSDDNVIAKYTSAQPNGWDGPSGDMKTLGIATHLYLNF